MKNCFFLYFPDFYTKLWLITILKRKNGSFILIVSLNLKVLFYVFRVFFYSLSVNYMKIGVLFFHIRPLYSLYICFLGVLNFIFSILYSPWACKESDTTERLSFSLLAYPFVIDHLTTVLLKKYMLYSGWVGGWVNVCVLRVILFIFLRN